MLGKLKYWQYQPLKWRENQYGNKPLKDAQPHQQSGKGKLKP